MSTVDDQSEMTKMKLENLKPTYFLFGYSFLTDHTAWLMEFRCFCCL